MDVVRRRKGVSAILAVLVLVSAAASAMGHEWVSVALITALVAGVVLLSFDLRARVRLLERRLVSMNGRLRSAEGYLRTVRRRTRRIQAATGSTHRTVSKLRTSERLAEQSFSDISRKVLAAIETERADAVTRHREVLQQPGVRMEPIAPRSELPEIAALLQYTDRVGARALLPAPSGSAMDPRALAHLVDIVNQYPPRTVLELGSGTSTVWLGYLLENLKGSRLVSIDHLAEHGALTEVALERHGLTDQVDLRIAPLVVQPPEVSDTPWYDAKVFDDVGDIDLLIVDGPPESTGPYARMAAMRVLAPRLSETAVILLDDSDREDEREVVESWMGDFDLERVDEGVSRLAVLRRRSS